MKDFVLLTGLLALLVTCCTIGYQEGRKQQYASTAHLLDSLESTRHAVIMAAHKKAWIDGANARLYQGCGWSTPEDGMAAYHAESVAFRQLFKSE